jgi:hypothetical protein
MPESGAVWLWVINLLVGALLGIVSLWVKDRFRHVEDNIRNTEDRLLRDIRVNSAQINRNRDRNHELANKLNKLEIRLERLNMQTEMKMFPRRHWRESEEDQG